MTSENNPLNENRDSDVTGGLWYLFISSYINGFKMMKLLATECNMELKRNGFQFMNFNGHYTEIFHHRLTTELS